MKARLKLTIEESLLLRIKSYAAKKQISLSELVEEYFEHIVQPVQGKTVLDMVRGMKAPGISSDRDLIDEYYNEIKTKHGV